METIDQAQAQRVWQRVRGAGEPEAELEGILLTMWENASALAQLSRRPGNPQSSQLRNLSRQEQSLCAALRGLCRVTGGKRPNLPQTPPISGHPEEILRRCYERSVQAQAALETRKGPVFAHLRDRELGQCLQILELLGKL